MSAVIVSATIATPMKRSLFERIKAEEFPDVDVREVKADGVKKKVFSAVSTIRNVGFLLNEYGITCRYNEMTKRVQIEIPGQAFSCDNKDNVALAEVKSACKQSHLPVVELREYLGAVAEQTKFHPVRDFILSKPWDGKHRLAEMILTIGVAKKDEALRDILMRRWFISAVAAAFSTNDEDMFYGVLVLQGAQNVGKTRWIGSLLPVELRSAFKEGFTLDPTNVDNKFEACSKWLLELGELDKTYKKSDVAELKAFLSNTHDEMRRPYAEMASMFKRRTVFAASVNPARFLVDDTGNRRWWTVPVLKVNYKHGLDMQQLWAEVYTVYLAGEQWWLSEQENDMLTVHNTAFEVENPMVELLQQFFNFNEDVTDATPPTACQALIAPWSVIPVTPTSICVALKLNFVGDKTRLGLMAKALEKLTGQKKKSIRVGPKKVVDGWNVMPYDVSKFASAS